MSWQQTDLRDVFDRALIFRIESTDGVDLVIEEVDTIRVFAAHWEQVEN